MHLRASNVLRRPTSPFEAFATALAVVVGLTIVYPLARMVVFLFVDGEAGIGNAIGDAFGTPGIGKVFLNTAILVIFSGALALVAGSAFAVLNERTDARMGRLTDLMPVVPLFIPPVASAIGWVFLASPRAGLLNVYLRDVLGWVGIEITEGPFNAYSWPFLIVVLALFELPFVFLIISAALRNVDPALEEAAMVSGSKTFRTFARITLPAVKPALAGACFLLVIQGLAFFSIPMILGSRAGIDVLTVHIVKLLRYGGSEARTDIAVVFGLVLVAVVSAAWLVQRKILAGGRFGTIGGKGARAVRIRLGRKRHVARAFMIGYLLITTVVPLAALVLVSLQPYWSGRINWETLGLDGFRVILFEDRANARAAFQNSLQFALVSATLGMLIASILTLYLRRGQRSGARLPRFVAWVTKLPAAIPNIILAVGFILAFAGPPFRLHSTGTILILAYIVFYLPIATVAADGAAAQVGEELPEAAAVCGSGPGRTARRIMLPLMAPGLAAGWALLFVRVIGELNAAALLSGAGNPVIGFVVLDVYENGSWSMLAALSTLTSAMTAAVVVGVLLLTRSRSDS